MRSPALLAALRIHVPAHTQTVMDACLATADAKVRAEMTKKLEESLKERIAQAEAGEKKAQAAIAASERYKQQNEVRTKELEAKSKAHDAEVAALKAQLATLTEEIDQTKERLDLAQSEVRQALETKRAAVEALAEELRTHATEKVREHTRKTLVKHLNCLDLNTNTLY